MFTDTSRAIVNTLIKNGYLEIIEKKVERNPLLFKEYKKTEKLQLTNEQQEAFDIISVVLIEEILLSTCFNTEILLNASFI